jgi:ornithine cyclodeaminase
VLRAGGGDWEKALADIRAALLLLGEGRAQMVAESVMPVGADPREKAYGLPASLSGTYDAAGLKWTVHRAAALGDQPGSSSLTIVNRLSDGRPIGIVESGHLTRMRTAAVSALAMRGLLAAAPTRVTILGAGDQAKAHFAMLSALFPDLASVTVWNRTGEAARAMVAGAAKARAVDGLADALDDADVVLCCTSSPTPLLGPEAVRPDRLIIQAGFHEVGFEAIAASDVVAVDLWGDFAEKSAKSLFQMYRAGRFDPRDVAVDLAGLAAGAFVPRPGTSSYFSSFGLNLFDIALAARVLRDAEVAGIGTVLPL